MMPHQRSCMKLQNYSLQTIKWDNEYAFKLSDGTTEAARIHTTSKLMTDKGHFIVVQHLKVDHNEQPFFERTYEYNIDRYLC